MDYQTPRFLALSYVDNNRDFIPNYGERLRQGEAISTAFLITNKTQPPREERRRQVVGWRLATSPERVAGGSVGPILYRRGLGLLLQRT